MHTMSVPAAMLFTVNNSMPMSPIAQRKRTYEIYIRVRTYERHTCISHHEDQWSSNETNSSYWSCYWGCYRSNRSSNRSNRSLSTHVPMPHVVCNELSTQQIISACNGNIVLLSHDCAHLLIWANWAHRGDCQHPRIEGGNPSLVELAILLLIHCQFRLSHTARDM